MTDWAQVFTGLLFYAYRPMLRYTKWKDWSLTILPIVSLKKKLICLYFIRILLKPGNHCSHKKKLWQPACLRCIWNVLISPPKKKTPQKQTFQTSITGQERAVFINNGDPVFVFKKKGWMTLFGVWKIKIKVCLFQKGSEEEICIDQQERFEAQTACKDVGSK